MVSFVTDYIQNTAATYLKAGIGAAGTMGGNAVGGVGGLIENSGRSVGQGISGSISGVGNYINGYGAAIQGSMAPDGPVGGGVKKTAVKAGDKKLPGAQKALPSAGGAPKALPAPGKGVGASRPPAAGRGALGAKPGAAQPPKRAPAGTPPASKVKPRGAPVNTGSPKPPNPRPATAGQKTSQQASSGKTKISSQSRPKPGVR